MLLMKKSSSLLDKLKILFFSIFHGGIILFCLQNLKMIINDFGMQKKLLNMVGVETFLPCKLMLSCIKDRERQLPIFIEHCLSQIRTWLNNHSKIRIFLTFLPFMKIFLKKILSRD